MPLYIANWKMYKTYDETVRFAQDHFTELISLSTDQKKIVLAPSFVCLDRLSTIFKNSPIAICAQNCATEKEGSYTGEVDAASLAQVGCQYTIVGHSERRNIFHETNQMVNAKIEMLFKHSITPIICIGEDRIAYEKGQTIEILANQLESIMKITAKQSQPYCIAYEPVWAIGSGALPSKEELIHIFEWLFNFIKDPRCTLLYGGSINDQNAGNVLQSPHLEGLLIGSASCNFQTLKKIVSLG